VPLSKARAVTENMLHDAVDTARPLDNGAMRAAMRWHSSLVRADLWRRALSGCAQTTINDTGASDRTRDGLSGFVASNGEYMLWEA
jgi:hypothetical protein